MGEETAGTRGLTDEKPGGHRLLTEMHLRHHGESVGGGACGRGPGHPAAAVGRVAPAEFPTAANRRGAAIGHRVCLLWKALSLPSAATPGCGLG